MTRAEPGANLTADICVIGAGSGGLSVAAGASQLGARTVLIERAHMGGDCLNFGCVPSKSLLAAAAHAHAHTQAERFGVMAAAPRIDFAAVRAHIRDVIAEIAPTDSVARFEGLGVTVLRHEARFLSPEEVQAGPIRIKARRFVIATGSRPFVPPIPGLDRVPYLTNETIFELAAAPRRLLVIGGGPIGLEIAQAFVRLGVPTSVVEMASILGREDPELVEQLRRRLRAEGLELLESTKVVRVDHTSDGVSVTVEGSAGERQLTGSHLLVAVGRQPNLEALDLVAAGIRFDRKGIQVDAGLKTTNRRVYAIGDVAGGPQFTHAAGFHAGVVIRNALFRLPARADRTAIPSVTYTDPELAQIGLTEAQARATGQPLTILRWPFAENDRARAERSIEGLVKVVATSRGRILGVSILGSHAGELLAPWQLAIGHKLPVKSVAELVLPYPTFGEASKRAAGSFFWPKLFAPGTRRIVRFLLRWFG
jgi:pyruvate/2-oxoglutarate dehydrogenase complex dihydrolipoamide dehydrogenase (E3) component